MCPREELAPNGFGEILFFWFAFYVKINFWAVHVDPIRASWIMMAPSIHIAKSVYTLQI